MGSALCILKQLTMPYTSLALKHVLEITKMVHYIFSQTKQTFSRTDQALFVLIGIVRYEERHVGTFPC